MKKRIWIVVFVGLFGACAWLSLNSLIWLIPQPETRGIALADLDGDGDLDAFLANGRGEGTEPNTVLWNDGHGRFRDSGQQLGHSNSWAVVLSDFDNDGDIDALVSSFWGKYFWNDGRGNFQRNQPVFKPSNNENFIGILRIKAADLNGDAQFDLFLTGCCGASISGGPGNWQTVNAYNGIWLTDGQELPRDSGQKLGLGSSEAVDLADLDGDGDLDAFTANSWHLGEAREAVDDPNMVWLNDGAGVFTDSGQRLGNQRSYAIALGDLDGDGDPDAFVGNQGSDEIWLNDGRASFTDSGQALGNMLTRFLYLAFLSGDSDLDAFAGDDKRGRLWLNDGGGVFTDSGQTFRYGRHHAVALGDVDGDGDEDIVAGEIDDIRVWYNDGTGRMR